MMRKLLWTAAGLWMLIGGVAWPAERPNLIIIGVDAMRPDHMSCYGYGRVTTPNIDALARRGVLFTDATTLIPLTNPAMSVFFTSRSPHITGVKRNGARLNPALETMTKSLKRAGYTTAAVPGCWALHHSRSGLEAGFDIYMDDGLRFDLELDAREVTRRSLAILDQLKPPFFFYTHYPDAHQPHKAQPGFEFSYEKDGIGPGTKTADNYDSELAFADHWAGVLLAEFEARGLLDNTIVFIMSDHGEELGERGGYVGHGRGMYQSVLRICALLRGPGLPAGVRFTPLVTLLDFAPTLLAALELPPLPDAEGRNLLPAVRTASAATCGASGFSCDLRGDQLQLQPGPVFFETYGVAILDLPGRKLVAKYTKPLIMGLREGDQKIFFSKRGKRWEYYDLARDPGEKENLFSRDNAAAMEMAARLSQWYEKQYERPLPLQ